MWLLKRYSAQPRKVHCFKRFQPSFWILGSFEITEKAYILFRKKIRFKLYDAVIWQKIIYRFYYIVKKILSNYMMLLFDGKFFIVLKLSKLSKKSVKLHDDVIWRKILFSFLKSKLFVTPYKLVLRPSTALFAFLFKKALWVFFGMPLNGVATVISFCTVPEGLGIQSLGNYPTKVYEKLTAIDKD